MLQPKLSQWVCPKKLSLTFQSRASSTSPKRIAASCRISRELEPLARFIVNWSFLHNFQCIEASCTISSKLEPLARFPVNWSFFQDLKRIGASRPISRELEPVARFSGAIWSVLEFLVYLECIGASSMAMGFGDSSLSLLSNSSAPVNAVSRLPGCCCRTTVILSGVSRFDSRVPRAGSWRKRLPTISAAESRSVDAAPQSTDGTTTGGSQAQSHLDLLQRMTENSTGSQGAQVKTIRDQLVSQGGEAEVPLAKLEKDKAVGVPELTISQKRNIRRQDYLNKVSERNDAPFFAIVAAIVLVPPIFILALAAATGYVDLFP